MELKFVASEAEQDVVAWAEDIDTKLTKSDKKVASIREILAKIDENEKGLQRVEAEKAQRTASDKERKTIGPWFGHCIKALKKHAHIVPTLLSFDSPIFLRRLIILPGGWKL